MVLFGPLIRKFPFPLIYQKKQIHLHLWVIWKCAWYYEWYLCQSFMQTHLLNFLKTAKRTYLHYAMETRFRQAFQNRFSGNHNLDVPTTDTIIESDAALVKTYIIKPVRTNITNMFCIFNDCNIGVHSFVLTFECEEEKDHLYRDGFTSWIWQMLLRRWYAGYIYTIYTIYRIYCIYHNMTCIDFVIIHLKQFSRNTVFEAPDRAVVVGVNYSPVVEIVCFLLVRIAFEEFNICILMFSDNFRTRGPTQFLCSF